MHLLDMKRDGKPTEGFVCSYDSETSEESCWQIEVMLILVIISLACTGITVAFVFSFCAMSGERGIEKVKLPTLMLAVFMSFFTMVSSIIALILAGTVDAGYMLKDWSFGYAFYVTCGQVFFGFGTLIVSWQEARKVEDFS